MNTTVSRRSWIVGVIVAALFSIALLNASHASAVTCTRLACDSKSPSASGCTTGATTLKEVWRAYDYGSVKLKFSSTCHAFWAEGRSASAYLANFELNRREIPGGDSYRTFSCSWCLRNTSMLGTASISGVTFQFRACVTVPGAYPYQDPICTGWYTRA